MKSITKLSAAFISALAVASTLAWSEPGDGADQQWERDSFYVDSVGVVIPCLAETMHFYGEVPYSRHSVTTPSGGTSYHYRLLPQTPNIPPFVGVGEASGKVYRFKNGHPLNESFHLAAGETLSVRIREMYVSDDGDKLVGNVHIHFTTNANGELTAEREIIEWICAD